MPNILGFELNEEEFKKSVNDIMRCCGNIILGAYALQEGLKTVSYTTWRGNRANNFLAIWNEYAEKVKEVAKFFEQEAIQELLQVALNFTSYMGLLEGFVPVEQLTGMANNIEIIPLTDAEVLKMLITENNKEGSTDTSMDSAFTAIQTGAVELKVVLDNMGWQESASEEFTTKFNNRLAEIVTLMDMLKNRMQYEMDSAIELGNAVEQTNISLISQYLPEQIIVLDSGEKVKEEFSDYVKGTDKKIYS